MDEFSGSATRGSSPPAPPRWRGIQSLDLVHQLNERCFELLSDVASNPSFATPLPLIADNRDLWTRLGIEARRAAARMPFVIVDAQFKNETWWRKVAESEANGAEAEPSTGLPREIREQLMHETTMFAWQTARWDRTVARLSLAMSFQVSEIIAELTPQQIRLISMRQSPAIRVRWDDDPQLWRDLLVAASAGNARKLSELHLHAKLLLCGELAQL